MKKMKRYVAAVVPKSPDYITCVGLEYDAIYQCLTHEYTVSSIEEFRLEDWVKDNAPCVQFEYDENYYGGDYSDTGNFAYIPVALMDKYGDELAFELVTEVDRRHIVDWLDKPLYNFDGEEIDDEESES